MLRVQDEDDVEAALADGRLPCRSCGRALAPWGFATRRVVRTFDGGDRDVRPRRAICHACGRTHVLLACSLVLRRRDEADVIGRALLAKARGHGHRTIARRLNRPVTTVRGWLRHFAAIAEPVRCAATRSAHALDASLAPIQPAASRFADAVEALGVAVRAWRLRFGSGVEPWSAAVWIAGGLLRPPPTRWPAL